VAELTQAYPYPNPNPNPKAELLFYGRLEGEDPVQWMPGADTRPRLSRRTSDVHYRPREVDMQAR